MWTKMETLCKKRKNLKKMMKKMTVSLMMTMKKKRVTMRRVNLLRSQRKRRNDVYVMMCQWVRLIPHIGQKRYPTYTNIK